MSIPSFIEEGLNNNLGLRISTAQSVYGGDVNHNYRITFLDDPEVYFLKFNFTERHQIIIESEAKALQLFHDHGIRSPRLFSHNSDELGSYLLLHYICPNKQWNSSSVESFAKLLATAHSIQHTHYGLSYNNCIGALEQVNGWYESFVEYYWLSRLLPQLKLAFSNNYLESPRSLEYLIRRLEDFPYDTPCLCHGDLWSGNYLIDPSNKAYLIDPSISYGHREMDLAMMDLFGGFPEYVFEAYDSELPIHRSWKERTGMFQLYYLLVHLNLFGISYLAQVRSILRKYE